MERYDAEKYLQLLGSYLQQQQLTGDILVHGDLLLFLDIRQHEVTQELQAYVQGDGRSIAIAAHTVAIHEKLTSEWLRDAIQVLLPSLSSGDWIEYPGIQVYTAPLEYMLAMGIVACTVKPESSEKGVVKQIASLLQLITAEDVIAHVTQFISEQALTREMRYSIEEMFSSEQRSDILNAHL